MCKRKKKEAVPQTEYAENAVAAPIEDSTPVVPRETDYFNEYYKAYKNNYIDKYLNAYHKFKATGEMDDTFRELQGYDIGTEPESEK